MKIYSNGINTCAIDREEDPFDPRIWSDNMGTMVCDYGHLSLGDDYDFLNIDDKLNDMILGDECGIDLSNLLVEYIRKGNDQHLINIEHDENEDLTCLLDNMSVMEKLDFLDYTKQFIILPLSVYEHGGITMRVGDKSQFVDSRWDASNVGFIYTTINKAKLFSGNNNITKDFIIKALKEEVAIYDAYLTGEVYNVLFFDGFNEEMLEDCYGLDFRDDQLNDLFKRWNLDLNSNDENFIEKDVDYNSFKIEEFLLDNFPDMYENVETQKTITVTEVRPRNKGRGM